MESLLKMCFIATLNLPNLQIYMYVCVYLVIVRCQEQSVFFIFACSESHMFQQEASLRNTNKLDKVSLV